MRVVYDTSICQPPVDFDRGIPRWIRGHVAALGADPRVTLTRTHDPTRPLRPELAPTWPAQALHRRFALAEPRVLHCSSIHSPMHLLHAVPVSGAQVRTATFYDGIPFVEEWMHTERSWLVAPRAVLPRFDAVLTLSRDAAAFAVRELAVDPRRVHVVGAGVDPPGDDPGALPPHLAHLAGCVLHTGGAEHPRKNVPRLVEAFARLPPALRQAHPLVITSSVPAGEREELDRVARAGGVAEAVHLVGRLTEAELAALRAGAACAVYPSLAEGFGLPIAEAMAAGLTVVHSADGACGELLVDARAGFDPRDTGSIAAALEGVLTEPGLAERLRALGHARARELTWRAVGERTVAAFRDALDRRARSVRRRRARPRPVLISVPQSPEPESAGEAIVATAAAMASLRPTIAAVDAPLVGQAGGAQVVPRSAPHDLAIWSEARTALLLEHAADTARALHLLAERRAVVVLWDFNRATGAIPSDLLIEVLRAAAAVVAPSREAAEAMVATAGPRLATRVEVLAPPILPAPARGPARATALLLSARPTGFPALDAEAIERAARIVGELACAGSPATVALLGPIDVPAFHAARAHLGPLGGRLRAAPWPARGLIDRWSASAAAMLDLGRDREGARVAADRAIRWRRPLVGPEMPVARIAAALRAPDGPAPSPDRSPIAVAVALGAILDAALP